MGSLVRQRAVEVGGRPTWPPGRLEKEMPEGASPEVHLLLSVPSGEEI